jgi:hypothetical protein
MIAGSYDHPVTGTARDHEDPAIMKTTLSPG